MSLFSSLFGSKDVHLERFCEIVDQLIEKQQNTFSTTRAGSEIMQEYGKYKVYLKDLVKKIPEEAKIDYKAVVYKDMAITFMNLYDFYKDDPFANAREFQNKAYVLLNELKRENKVTEEEYKDIMTERF